MNRGHIFRRKLPGQPYRHTAAVSLCTTLPLLAWRLLDVLGEVINGPIKLSLGKYVVTGNAATALQLLIIGILVYLALSAAYAIGPPAKHD